MADPIDDAIESVEKERINRTIIHIECSPGMVDFVTTMENIASTQLWAAAQLLLLLGNSAFADERNEQLAASHIRNALKVN